MTPYRPSRWITAAFLVALSVAFAGCGGGSGDPPVGGAPTPTASPTRRITPPASPTASPTGRSTEATTPLPTATVDYATPASTPTLKTSSAVRGVLLLQRNVSANAGDALGAAPEQVAPRTDQASFDRALSHADWSVAGTDLHGVTSADGRFEITGLAAGQYTLQINKTLDGNLASFAVPFTVGDNGGAEILAEVALGEVKSISTFTQSGAPAREVVGPNGSRTLLRDGHVTELGDTSRTLVDGNGDGRFDSSACAAPMFACDAGGRCGDTLIPCVCISACPFCDGCKLPGVCQPPNGSPYQCGADGGCARAGDHCACVPSCPECKDCQTRVCVPGCEPIEIQSIDVSGVTQLVVGQQGYLNAIAQLSDGTTIDVTYLADWHSSDETVATVDSWGLVSALSIGTTTITATIGSLTSAQWPLTVVARPALRNIYLQNTSCMFPLGAPERGDATAPPVISPPAPTDILPVPSCTQVVQIGGTIQFRALGEFDGGYYQDITDEVQWRLSPAEIGTVDKGLFTGTHAGSTKLTAALSGVTSDASDIRVVTEPTVIGISIYAQNAGPPVVFASPAVDRPEPCFDCGYSLTVLRGDTLRFHATAQYDIGAWKDVTDQVVWHTSDDSIASIDPHGVMTAAKEGGADITATLAEVTSNVVSVQIVNDATLQSIYIYQEGGDQVVAKGDQRFFRANGFYDVGGLNRDVTAQAAWRSGDELVGGFGAPGVFTARAGGTVQVWAELDGRQSNPLSLTVFETSELHYCDPMHINRSVWSDDFNRVVLESDCASYQPPGVATLRYTVTETQPHGGIFRPCLDLYVYQGDTRVRTIREEGCGAPFMPPSPEAGDEVLKYQLRAFWDLKDDTGKPVSPGAYKIYGRFYLYYDPVISLDVAVLRSDGTLPTATPTPKPTSHGSIPPTPTPTPPPTCTPVRCDAPGVLACLKGYCPGGCGYQCVTPTPTPMQSCCPAGAACIPELPPCPATCCPRNVSCTDAVPPCLSCGGITGAGCPTGYECIDDPTDDCAPPTGADCGGICVPAQPNQCKSDSDCPQIRAPCTMCADGTVACPTSVCDHGVCRVSFQQCGSPTPTPTPAGPVGACFKGAHCDSGSFFSTSQSQCCLLSQMLASPVGLSWCPPGQLDAAGNCFACGDPCKGLPTPTPSPTEPPFCTPPMCGSGEVYYCSGICPLGCRVTCVTPTPIPSGPAIAVEPVSLTVSCADAFTIRITNSGNGSPPLIIMNLALDNGYSQGEYGTGFTWDTSQITLPATLPAGASLVIPVKYQERDFPFSRLELNIDSNAENMPHLFLTYHGRPCETPTPTPDSSGQGACFRGANCPIGSFFKTTQSECCKISRLSASAFPFSWCPADQLDASTGQCAACSDPCDGLPTPTPTPANHSATSTPTAFAQPVVLAIGSAAGAPGSTVSIPVTLHAGGQQVAGTDNDLLFDPAVVNVASCRINPEISSTTESCQDDPTSGPCKTLTYAVADCPDPAASSCPEGLNGKRRLRVLVLALNNTTAIPDGVLYTCQFSIATSASGSTTLETAHVDASSPKGQRLQTVGVNGRVDVAPAPAS